MKALLSMLMGRLYFYASMLGGIGLALAAAWFKGWQAGRDRYIAKRAAEKARARQAGEEIRHEVSQASDRSLDRRLGRWMRD